MKFLIVVDMQKDFIDGVLGTAEPQKIVDKVVHKIDSFDGGSTNNYYNEIEKIKEINRTPTMG